MKVYSGKQWEKGFTMLEVVLVVAILSIAMMITVPGLVRLSRDLELKKLDDIAKEIYTSAQSRAVSLSVSGQLSQVGGMENAVPLAEDDPAAPKVTIAYVTRVSASDSIGDIELLLPLGSIEEVVRQNYYLIEYDPVTAAIIGVYYWEDEKNNFPEKGYRTMKPANRDERMEYMVGYYGGEDIDRLSPPTKDDSAVTAELVNDEELYLKITQGVLNGKALEGTITVTLTDMDEGGSKEIASFRNENKVAVPFTTNNRLIWAKDEDEKYYYKLTLDSLLEGLRFSEIQETIDGNSFHPGCELKVTVTFQEDGKQVWSKDFRTNSLFASVDGEYGEERTAYIACGRHLENLGVRFVYPGSTCVSDELNGVTKAVQTKDIDWKGSVAKVGGEAPTLFTPIVNHKNGDHLYLKEYDGKGNTISHLNISDEIGGITGGLGMFSQFMGERIENVDLVNCTLTGSESDPQPAGLLAGSVTPAETCVISNCRAYAEKEKNDAGVEIPITIDSCSINMPGAVSAGGLFGSVQNAMLCLAYATADAGGMLDCSIDVPAAYSAGGLFGSVQDATLEKCSASLTKLAGGTYVGGLAGQTTDNVTINRCYADTGLWSSTENKWASGLSGKTAGGLLGSAGGSLTLENSYAVGWIDNSTKAYGLVGSGSSGSIKNCYAAVAKGGGSAALAPVGIAREKSFNYLEAAQSPPSSPFVKATAGTTHAYGMSDPEDGPLVYPFPRLSDMPHYGDWPTAGRMSMAYYEVYQNDGKYSIGFYSSAKKGDKVMTISTLKDSEDFTVVMDGYAVMLPTDAGDIQTVKYNGHEITESSTLTLEDALLDASKRFKGMSVEVFDSKGNITVKAMTYHPLFLSNAMMLEEKNTYADKTSYYQKLEFKAGGFEVNVWFNPYVAKSEFVKVEDTPAPQKPLGDTILRTSRQVTAYSCNAMQTTAVGNGETPHTLRLERNISLAENGKKFKTDSGDVDCVDLNISTKFVTAPNVVLELNGKILTGTGDSSVVSSKGGTLKVYGRTQEDPHVGTAGTIQGGGGDGDSVNAAGDVTIVGCTILGPA